MLHWEHKPGRRVFARVLQDNTVHIRAVSLFTGINYEKWIQEDASIGNHIKEQNNEKACLKFNVRYGASVNHSKPRHPRKSHIGWGRGERHAEYLILDPTGRQSQVLHTGCRMLDCIQVNIFMYMGSCVARVANQSGRNCRVLFLSVPSTVSPFV